MLILQQFDMEYITLNIVEKATNRRRISKCVQPELQKCMSRTKS